ncbi:hypothetical protein BGX27_003366, partial [Mortierella sp. AM989]
PYSSSVCQSLSLQPFSPSVSPSVQSIHPFDRDQSIQLSKMSEDNGQNQHEFLPRTMVGARYFHETPVTQLTQEGFILSRGAVANSSPLQVASEWNAIRAYFLSPNCNSSEHRLFAQSSRAMTRKFVIATTKALNSSRQTPISDSPPEGSQVSSSSSPSFSPSASSSSASSEKIRDLFIENYHSFEGSSLKLESGAELDGVVYNCVISMSKQSSLHSFIIDSREFNDVTILFPPEDRDELKKLLDEANLASTEYRLQDWQTNVINYYESISSVDDVYRRGWDNIFTLEGIAPEGHQDFSRFIFDFMNDIFRFYKQYGQQKGQGQEFELLDGLSERTYLRLWNIIFKALWINGEVLKLDEGEISSSASACRRNGVRSLEDRQSGGHKIDGILTAAKAKTEIGAIEGGKKNESSYGTKYLTDGVKTAKTLKDMFDMACSKAALNGNLIKNDLEVYGYLVSGLRIEFVTFKYFGGRFFLFKRNYTDDLPPILNNNTIWKVKRVLEEFLLMRKRMEDMATMLEKSIYGKGSKEKKNYVSIPTLTTPPPSPKTKKMRLV